MLFGGVFLTIPVVGHVVVLGYLAAMVFSAAENAVIGGGLSALGAALYSIGVPKNSVLQYETAIKADKFLVMAHGTETAMMRAREILDTLDPLHLHMHTCIRTEEPVDLLARG